MSVQKRGKLLSTCGLLIILLFLLSSCGNSEKKNPLFDLSEKGGRWIEPDDTINFDGMNLFWYEDNLQFAMDDHARLALYVCAEKYEDRFVWDDGQDWLLVLETSLGNYAIFPRQFLQFGIVSCTVFHAWNDESNAFDIMHILVIVKQNAGHRIYEYVFDYDQQAFRIEQIYQAHNMIGEESDRGLEEKVY